MSALADSSKWRSPHRLAVRQNFIPAFIHSFILFLPSENFTAKQSAKERKENDCSEDSAFALLCDLLRLRGKSIPAFIEFLLKALRIALREVAVPAPISGEKGTQSAPSQHQVAILRQCRTETAIGVLMAIAGRSDRTKFRNQILNPLLAEDWVEMTLPDKPNSRLQKYRITEKGRRMTAE